MKKRYTLNGKNYNVDVNSQAGIEWLKNNPTAILVGEFDESGQIKVDPTFSQRQAEALKKKTGSTESATVEPKKKAQTTGDMDLSLEDGSLDYVEQATARYESYKANEEQSAEASKRASAKLEELNYLSSTNYKQIAKDEETEEGIFEGIGTAISAVATLQTQANKRYGDALEKKKKAKKEQKELYNKAFDLLLQEENKNRSQEERIQKTDANGNLTEEYSAWVNATKESGLADETAKSILQKQYEDEYFDENIEKSIEDRTSWYDFTMTESQLEEEEIAKKAVEQLSDEAKKAVKSQEALLNSMTALGVKSKQYEELSLELNSIGRKLENITSKQYTTQEEYDAAVAQYDQLKAQYDNKLNDYESKGGLSFEQLQAEQEMLVSAYERIQERSEDIIKSEEDLKKYIDAVGRNYNFITNVYGQAANSFISMGASYASFVSMIDDMIESAASNLPEQIQGEAANLMRLYSGPLSATLLVNKGIESASGDDAVEEVSKALYGYSEAISNGLEAPAEFSEIKDLKSAGEWYAHMVASQSANTAVTLSTGGASLFVLGATSAGQKYHDLQEEMKQYAELPDGHPMKDFKYSKAQQYSSAIFSGAVEGLSEKITLGQINKVKGLLSTNTVMKRGFDNFLYRNFATRRGLYNNFYDPIEEGASELASQFGSNVIDRLVLGKENSLLEGLDESFVSGVLMSGTVFKAPAIGKNIIKAFQSTDVSAEIDKISADLAENRKKLLEEDISDKKRAALEANRDQLVERYSTLMSETMDGYENMSKEDRQLLIGLDVENAVFLSFNKELDKGTSSSAEEARKERAMNNEMITRNKLIKDSIINRAALTYNAAKISRSSAKAQRDLEKITGKPVKIIRATKENFKEAAEEFRKLTLEYFDGEIKSLENKIESTTKDGDKIELEYKLKRLQQQRDSHAKADYSEGANSDGFTNESGNILVNTDVATRRGATNVANHEFLHIVLRNTLSDNPAAAVAMAEAVSSYLDNINPDTIEQSVLAERLKLYKDDPLAVRAEEMVTLFLDAVASGDIKVNTSSVGRLKNAFSDIIASSGLNRKNIQLNTAQDVVDFIVNFQDSRNSIFGFRRRAAAKRAARGLDISGDLYTRGSLRAMREADVERGDAEESTIRRSMTSDVTDTVDELGKMGWDNNTWKEQGYSFALTEMQENKMFDRLIASKLKVPMSPDDTREFVAKVYAELTSHVKNFRPDDNDSLFGWINSQLSNKAGNVYNREYKATEETRGVDIDATTSEGNPVIQIADDVDYEMARIDDIGLNDQQRDDKSRLRRDLGLNEEMVEKVKNAVIKTFGTKLPSVDAKDFKKALEKAFATELKKPIQDMMGGREDFDMFLVDHFSAVFDALPASTLVQMERNLDPEQRIFTTSERITKPTEVDRLVAEGRLPKDVNRLSGPMLHTKKPTPNTRQVLAYFRGKDMQNVLGYKVGGSTLGTRKDKLAIEIGVELAFDATSEVIQMPEVQERRKNILELQGYEMLENDVAMVAKAIDRDPGIRFSKSMPNILFSKNIAKEDLDVYVGSLDGAVKLMRENKVDLRNVDEVEYYLREHFEDNMSDASIKASAKSLSGYAFTFVNQLKEIGRFKSGDDITKLTLSSEDIYDWAINNAVSEVDILEVGLFKQMQPFLPEGTKSIKSLRTKKNLESSRSAVKSFLIHIKQKEYNRLIDSGVSKKKAAELSREKMIEQAKFMSRSFSNGTKGSTLFENVDQYIKALGIKDKSEWNKAGKGEFKMFPQSAKGFMAEKNYEERKKASENAQKLVVEFYEFMVNRAKLSANPEAAYVDLALAASSMNSSVQGLLRAAAELEYVAEGYENIDPEKANSELRYEHVYPAVKKLNDLFNEIIAGNEISSNFWNNYKVALIPKSMDNALNTVGFKTKMNIQYKEGDNPLDRYYNFLAATTGELVAVKSLADGKVYGKDYERLSDLFRKGKEGDSASTELAIYTYEDASFSSRYSRSVEINPKGMSTFDFDETLIIHGENFIIATKDGEELKISSGDWPLKGPALQQEGWEFDFSDFVNVRGGVEGPLLQKMRNQIEKFGNKNVFVLTARPAEAQLPIYEWLKSKGINLPIENITGLGDGRGEAKAAWMLKKYSEGYNDMYFVDDALPNVQAVKQVMDEFDIKGKSVQAMIRFSKSASEDFNDMLERVSGVRSEKTFSGYEAKVEGKGKGRFKFFVPPSAEDFKGLVYSFLGTGKQGDADLKWFEENLFVPYAKAIKEFDSFNQTVSEDYAKIRSEFNDVTSRFKDEVPGTKLNLEQAIRVFLFAQADVKIPGMDSTTISIVREYMKNDEAASAFAVALSQVTRNKRGYVKPKQYWLSGSIASDLVINSQEARKSLLKEWSNKKDLVFSESNMNKIEAIYGPNFREALDNILWRMENGTNKYRTGDPIVNKFVNWINGSVGAVMFFNMRSAVLQTMSAVNYINWSDNNLFEAAKAFANQKQYWSDVSTLFNSDMLKQRRSGLKIDVSASELSNAFNTSGGKVEGVIAWLLEKGFKPTQIADSLAIATGGATFYRNRIKKYLKDGLDKSKAEEQAFMDFMEITEENQQSSRPDLISQQQAGPLGRMILAWQNTPMQYTRLTKKALSDLVNGRGDWKTNVSKILYYGMVQNVLFGAIQSGLMFMMFGGDDDEEELNKKSLRVANGTLDTLLRGTGVYGAAAATLKNVIMKWYEESEKGFGKKDMSKVAVEMVNLSPPIGSKVRKVMNAIKSYDYNKDVMKKMDYSFNNPGWDVLSNLVEATTNVPLARVVNKAKNVELALSATTDPWQKAALMLGWNKWDIGLEDVELEEARKSVKEDKAEAAKERREVRKEERKAEREVQKEQEAKEKEEQGIKQVRCSHIKNDGSRCKVMVETRNDTALCQYHKNYDEKEGSDINNDGVKEFQCTATTSSGKRCKNRTENKNKRCYAHQ